MSQIGVRQDGGGAGNPVLFLRGDDLVQVGPTIGGIINVVGGTDMQTSGNAGTNTITVTFNGANAGMSWTVENGAGPIDLVAGNGYFANNAGTISFLLPAAAAIGDTFAVAGMNNNLSWIVNQRAGQSIRFGNNITTVGVGGDIHSLAIGNSITFVCNVVNTGFLVIASQGNPDII